MVFAFAGRYISSVWSVSRVSGDGSGAPGMSDSCVNGCASGSRSGGDDGIHIAAGDAIGVSRGGNFSATRFAGGGATHETDSITKSLRQDVSRRRLL
jgi:hypothetical protein